VEKSIFNQISRLQPFGLSLEMTALETFLQSIFSFDFYILKLAIGQFE